MRGVTYGPFRPESDGSEYHDAARAGRDFGRMRSAGINTIRIYTVPPPWLLDCAGAHDLRVLVGLPWEQHIAFLGDRRRSRQIENSVRKGVRSCAGHPALLGFAIGNEVPSSVVRWHGHQRVEQHIERLYQAAKTEDPGALVTYVNYPSTEYLELPFLDFHAFNLYLESPAAYSAYLARLQNLAGDKPLVVAETGLDSRRNGLAGQAQAMRWQIREAFAAGCAGVVVFAWTDEWHRNHQDVEDWDFGLTRREGGEKPALAAVCEAFADSPFPPRTWPRVSVVVCTHQGAKSLRDCLAGLQQLEYPDVERLVVNDGSDPEVAAIAGAFPVRLLDIPHSGLSVARNVGLAAATGEIVAYLDDDAYPDPHWLHYLVAALLDSDFAAMGGPNIPPATRHALRQSLALGPGGPSHVLLSDREAEHIPGCNMAFWKTALQSMGGFDPQFWVAGDDVDICWRFRDAGLRIGFAPGAVVWHHRRPLVRDYWRQQAGYGRAEALLERKWPSRFNAVGQPTWSGRIYGPGLSNVFIWGRPRVYHGTWGSALFQSMYVTPGSHVWSLARMPEWYLGILALIVLWMLAPLWEPLYFLWPIALASIFIPVLLAAANAGTAGLSSRHPWATRAGMRILIAWLHLIQPAARLWGRLRSGLTPWRSRSPVIFSLPGLRRITIWSERWRSSVEWLQAIEVRLQTAGVQVHRGGAFDRWDLDVPGGLMGSVRMSMLIEEHGAGKQLVRVRAWPHCPLPVTVLVAGSAALAVGVLREKEGHAAIIFGSLALLTLLVAWVNWGLATAHLFRVLRREKRISESLPPRSPPESAEAPPPLRESRSP